MYAVADAVVGAKLQPAGKPLSDFQHYCERALSGSLSGRSMSLPTPDSGSIGHHDDLISWLPRGARSGDVDGHVARRSMSLDGNMARERVAVQQALATSGACGLRFSDAALERGFGRWMAGVMHRVDVVGALLSLLMLLMPARKLGGWAGLSLLVPPAVVLTLATTRRQWCGGSLRC